MKSILIGLLLGVAVHVRANQLLFDEIWRSNEWEVAEVEMEVVGKTGVGRASDAKNTTTRNIPVARLCKCHPGSCACCLVYTKSLKEQNKVCIGLNATENKGFATVLQVYTYKTNLIVFDKSRCLPLPQAPFLVEGCFKPYGTHMNATSIRTCIQLGMKFAGVKMGSVDLDCFRINFNPRGIKREKPADSERPKGGWFNRGYRWVTGVFG